LAIIQNFSDGTYGAGAAYVKWERADKSGRKHELTFFDDHGASLKSEK
jgi:hypothetical protein